MSVFETFITDTLGLTKLPPHFPTFIYAFVGFSFVHQVLAPWASNKLFPITYGTKNARAQNTWLIHVVSQVHAVIIVPSALWVVWREKPDIDRAFGWSYEVGHVHAIACGYFLWDSLDAVINFTDLGFVIHGIACLMIYSMSYKPFVAYYGIRCLLWESSTIFLNIHWFLDKTKRTGSLTQLVNGFFLLSTFFGARLLYGGKVSYDFVHTLIQVRHEVTWTYVLVYGAGNVILMSLNWLWFYKMITALRRRFSSDTPKEQRRLVNPYTDDSGNSHVHAEEGNLGTVGNGYGTQP